MIKKSNLFMTTALAVVTVLLLTPQPSMSEAAKKISKPAGASGMGTVAVGQPQSNQFWWPGQLDLSPLRNHDPRSNPLGEDFNYAEAFKKLDLQAVKKDIDALLTTSQDWWQIGRAHV